MKPRLARGIKRGLKLGLSRRHAATLARLDTPEKAQDFIDRLKHNFEPQGDTCNGVVETLRSGRAHCIEGAFVAACGLWLNGHAPLLMDLRADRRDDDHVVVLFRRFACWGAISKTNHVWLRWRDPVYRTLRELAMSYFHEYTLRRAKTLRAFSRPFDLRRLDPQEWVTAPHGAWEVADKIDAGRHYKMIGAAQARQLRSRDATEMRANLLLQYKRPAKRRGR